MPPKPIIVNCVWFRIAWLSDVHFVAPHSRVTPKWNFSSSVSYLNGRFTRLHYSTTMGLYRTIEANQSGYFRIASMMSAENMYIFIRQIINAWWVMHWIGFKQYLCWWIIRFAFVSQVPTLSGLLSSNNCLCLILNDSDTAWQPYNLAYSFVRSTLCNTSEYKMFCVDMGHGSDLTSCSATP
jgi:hypothetical protein